MRVKERNRRGGFTLIEMMIVIFIIGLLVVLATAAFMSMVTSAKAKTTNVLIKQLDSALQERIESFMYETRSITPTNRFILLADPASPGTTAWPNNSIVFRRGQLVTRLDAMRGDFPQQFVDFLRGDLADDGVTAATPDGSAPYIGLGRHGSSRPARTAIMLEYLKRTKSTASDPNPQATEASFDPSNQFSTQPLNHDPKTESSECLYLILSTQTEGMSFDVDDIPPEFVRDTDGDGLLEFVDSWGKPLQFFRWPTDYYAYLIDVSRQLTPSAGRSTIDPEDLLMETTWFDSTKRPIFETTGFYRLHQAYPLNVTYPPQDESSVGDLGPADDGTFAARSGDPRAYSVVPLILSAGPDGEFGLHQENPAVAAGGPEARQMHLRSGRIDPIRYELTHDNVRNIELKDRQ